MINTKPLVTKIIKIFFKIPTDFKNDNSYILQSKGFFLNKIRQMMKKVTVKELTGDQYVMTVTLGTQ